MNGTSSAQQGIQQPVKQQALPKERKVGLFGILFIVGIVLVLLLAALNYSNILSLSRLFPSQLWWLPHKAPMPSPQPTSTQNQNYSPDVFQYNTEKAKKTVSQYIKETLKPEFIPKTLVIRQGLSIDNRVDNNLKYQFGTYFTSNQSAISVNFHYKEGANTPNDYIIFIQPSKIDKTPLTSTLATTLTASYFTNPYTPIENCSSKGTTSYCETFRTEDKGKRGYGAIFTEDQFLSSSKPTLIIFTCFVPKESKDYVSQKSCINP